MFNIAKDKSVKTNVPIIDAPTLPMSAKLVDDRKYGRPQVVGRGDCSSTLAEGSFYPGRNDRFE